MKSRRRLLFVVVLVSAFLAMSAASDGRPWGASSGPGAKVATSRAPSPDQTVETWILVGVIVIGFGALTIRMLRYRREMQSSVLRRMRREWEEGRALLLSGRSFLKEHFDRGLFTDRRATPRNNEREANA